MNPFDFSSPITNQKYYNWKNIYPIPYDKNTTSTYTKARVILMNGCETEQVFFLHQFSRNCPDNDLRRELAKLRRIEQQQQKLVQCLKPINENILEETIIYELLAVDLTARLAKKEPDQYVKQALDFALLEDFDHLYRYSNLMKVEYGKNAEFLVGKYTEIMPARPTISHHRHPVDTIRRPTDSEASTVTKLHCNIITAAEQQTMNFYMNVCNLYPSDIGRRLYQEIGMVEEDHVTHYGSLLNTNMTLLENLVMHMYTACYLYYSCLQDEDNQQAKCVWKECFYQEVANLKLAARLLENYENKHWSCVISEGAFPELLSLGPNVEYIRDILKNTVTNTTLKEDYCPINLMPLDSDFFLYQSIVNNDIDCVPSHNIICTTINKLGVDYRYEKALNPITSLQARNTDNITLGRVPDTK
mgnify:FL=1